MKKINRILSSVIDIQLILEKHGAVLLNAIISNQGIPDNVFFLHTQQRALRGFLQGNPASEVNYSSTGFPLYSSAILLHPEKYFQMVKVYVHVCFKIFYIKYTTYISKNAPSLSVHLSNPHKKNTMVSLAPRRQGPWPAPQAFL